MFELSSEVRTADDDVAAALAYARSVAGRSHVAEDLAMHWALAHPEAARLAAARPGPALTWRLTDLAVADAPSEDLLEALGAWERTAAWVAAEQARVLQELQRRVAASTWAQKGLREDVAGTLAVSGRAAGILCDRARELTAAPEVHDALREGVLSVRKADVLLRDTGSLPASEARRVHDALIAQAPLLTAPQLGAAARRAVLELDPHAAEARHRQAREERCVVLEPAADCMATIRAYLPATDAVRAMRALDAVAAAAAPEDPRGIDARRADALVDVLAAVLDAGVSVQATSPGRRRRRTPRLNLTISTDALAGATSTAGFLDGYGPVLPSLARRLAHEAAWHFVRTDPATGEALEQPGSRYRPPEALRSAIIARDVTCTFPGCRVSAQVCDLDHTVPFDDTREAAEQTRRSNLTALCRHHHRLKTHGRWTPSRDPDSGVVVWTSPGGKPYTRDPVEAPGEPDRRLARREADQGGGDVGAGHQGAGRDGDVGDDRSSLTGADPPDPAPF
ncbi:HNH endonuclease signature motif containing protein [Actinotalea sp. Marseille-Q4924]|uniref:HNH endonuclease signature motif containing protein n=1 Tax=Actinotalea sp. Marseille-Q4924 TaxID=2866571 RepID=UPI00271514C7|nr:HNH endonuclease signature motif containing protein [Actinotalea sp. Marseille-Q4924]